jgi:hypothetical protein
MPMELYRIQGSDLQQRLARNWPDTTSELESRMR